MGGEDYRREDEKIRTASREPYGTLFTVFAIVKAANIYMGGLKRTRVLGVTRVLLASEKSSRIVRKLIPRRFADEQ